MNTPESAERRHVMIVLANPVPGREAEFNDWYDNDHVARVLEIPGFESVRRFRHVGSAPGNAAPYAYAAIYEIVAADVAEPLAALAEARPAMPSTDAFGPNSVTWCFEQLGPDVRAASTNPSVTNPSVTNPSVTNPTHPESTRS